MPITATVGAVGNTYKYRNRWRYRKCLVLVYRPITATATVRRPKTQAHQRWHRSNRFLVPRAIVAAAHPSSHRGCIEPSWLHRAIVTASSHRGCVKPSWLHRAIVAVSSHRRCSSCIKPSALHQAIITAAHAASPSLQPMQQVTTALSSQRCCSSCIKPSSLRPLHQTIVTAGRA